MVTPRARQSITSPRRLSAPLDLSFHLQLPLDVSHAVDTPIGPRKPCGRRHRRRPSAPVPPVQDVASMLPCSVFSALTPVVTASTSPTLQHPQP
jgi:hypothetical protein